jgi:hypothetical protein
LFLHRTAWLSAGQQAGQQVTIKPELPLDEGVVPSAFVPSPHVDPAQAETTTAVLETPPAATGSQPQSRTQLWLHRTSVFLFVLISAVAGVLLVILPWTPEWTDNYLLLSFPWLRSVVTTVFFRGLCSGLGLLDIWIGFWEALHYHEHS